MTPRRIRKARAPRRLVAVSLTVPLNRAELAVIAEQWRRLVGPRRMLVMFPAGAEVTVMDV